jgi:hypothetical protein
MAKPNKLRTREEVHAALEALGRWKLENCRWDWDPAAARYQASHERYGVVAAQSGPELVALVTQVEEAAEELAQYGVSLNRGNPYSPTSAWWAGEVLSKRSSWANDLQDLLMILRRRGERGQVTRNKGAAGAAPPPDQKPERTLDDGAGLPARVHEVAAGSPESERFGPNKVFIAYIWQQLQGEWSSRDAFDAALLAANRARTVSLTRADLVGAMEQRLVAESEIRDHGARFHFVVIPGVRGW